MTEAAYAACLRLAREHYENFPVASRLLPAASRPHVAAIYAFARTADDFADEGDRPAEERLGLLDEWRSHLYDAAAGRVPGDDSVTAAIFTALAQSMRVCQLDVGLLDDLLSAFRQDVVVSRYETWSELADYCRRSANPVGRLVLRVAGHRDAELDGYADAVCTALQLTNFWQDLARDWAKGRLYVPLELVRAAGAGERDLDARAMSPAWQSVLAGAVAHTRACFRTGRPIGDRLGGRLGWELRATWLGGMRILDRLESVHFDVFDRRPRLGWRDAAAIGWRVVAWQ